MNYEKIGSNIKTAMLNKNVTNEKLAKKMDIPEKRLVDILEGREHPSLDTLILISMLLNVNINGLFSLNYHFLKMKDLFLPEIQGRKVKPNLVKGK